MLDTFSAVNKWRIALITDPVVNRCLKIGRRARSSSKESKESARSERVSGKSAVRGWNHLLPVASGVASVASSTAPVRRCTPLRATLRALRPERIARPRFFVTTGRRMPANRDSTNGIDLSSSISFFFFSSISFFSLFLPALFTLCT